MVVKSTQRKVKLKPGKTLYMSSLSVMLLAMLAALALLNVRQMCPELGFIPSLYTTILTFGARRFENALKSGDARTSRTILEDSTRMLAPLVSTLPGEEPKVTRFEVPIGGIRPDRSDTLSGLVYHPNSTARDLGEQRCVAIFIHGGGWIVGSIFQSSQRCKDLAKASDMIVVALQYRLAPEFVFPTQINDVQRGFRYIRRHAAEWGGDPECIAIMGDSAGAGIGLTVGILSSPQWWRRRAPLCAIAATSLPLPYSHVAKHDSCKAYGKNYMMEASFFELCWNAYMGPLKHDGDWRASPMQAPSSKLQKLRGTPILLAVAEQEIFRDGVYEMHEKFLSVGVESTLAQFNRTVHAFFSLGPPFDPGFECMLRIGDFLKTNCRAKGQVDVDVSPEVVTYYPGAIST